MNVAIIGAGRNRNGIGHYIGKFFQKNGARVRAVLGTTAVSARQAARALTENGVPPEAYTDFSALLQREPVDAVVIASPDATHLTYLNACIDAGVHIFCEKPLLHPATANLFKTLDALLTSIKRKGLTIAMNSQWPFTMPHYERLCGRVRPETARSFRMDLSPLPDGLEMIPDSMPHALSLLYAVLGKGDLADLKILTGTGTMTVTGVYHARMTECRFDIRLTRHERQPRPFSFGWNGRMIHRRLTMQPYRIFFQRDADKLAVPDPLELSVQRFISAAGDGTPSPVGATHIFETALMLQRIYKTGKLENEKKQATQ